MSSPINFFSESISPRVAKKKVLKSWVQKIIASEDKTTGAISIILCDDGFLHNMNVKYLNHDTYTDIITFDYEEDLDVENNEVLISWDRVVENAKTFNECLKNELHRVCIHGLLHLAGHNDRSNKEKQKMRALEDMYINLYCST